MKSLLSHFPVPVLGFAAYSGTGKTTLLEQLLPLLSEQAVRVALVKHSHHDIELDKPGKDSYRLRKAGANQVVLAGTQRSVVFHEQVREQDSLLAQLALLQLSDIDIVLVEGFRDEAFAKIELHRQALGKPLLHPNDVSILAIASDRPLADCSIEQLELNNYQQLVSWIVQYIEQFHQQK